MANISNGSLFSRLIRTNTLINVRRNVRRMPTHVIPSAYSETNPPKTIRENKINDNVSDHNLKVDHVDNKPWWKEDHISSCRQYEDFDIPPFKEITSEDKIKKAVVHTKTNSMRERYQSMLLEGKSLILAAQKAELIRVALCFSENHSLRGIEKLEKFKEIYKIPPRVMLTWSTMSSPPDVMGVYKIPKQLDFAGNSPRVPLTLVIAQVRIPENVATILQSAAEFGIKRVILMKGTCSLWNTKLLRGATGAHFRLNLVPATSWEELPELISPNARIFVADACEDDQGYDAKSPRGILLPVKHYDAVNILPDRPDDQELVLIAGSEVGLCAEAREFAKSRGGEQLVIPMANSVESLNTAMATSIIMHQLCRRFHKLAAPPNLVEEMIGSDGDTVAVEK